MFRRSAPFLSRSWIWHSVWETCEVFASTYIFIFIVFAFARSHTNRNDSKHEMNMCDLCCCSKSAVCVCECLPKMKWKWNYNNNNTNFDPIERFARIAHQRIYLSHYSECCRRVCVRLNAYPYRNRKRDRSCTQFVIHLYLMRWTTRLIGTGGSNQYVYEYRSATSNYIFGRKDFRYQIFSYRIR